MAFLHLTKQSRKTAFYYGVNEPA